MPYTTLQKLPSQPDIVLAGDPTLMSVQPSVQTGDLQSEVFQHNLDVLIESQRRSGGVGIAAPQIGWSCRVMSLGIEKANPRYPDAKTFPIECWVNPEVIWSSAETVWAWEGCLSVPGVRGWVERSANIRVRGFDRQGVLKEHELSGFMARIFLHEVDHLDGVLFPQRVSNCATMVPLGSFENQQHWPENWPTPGAFATRPGEVSDKA